MNLLKPRLLKKGDTIGFLSVCGDIKDYSKLEFAKEYFQNIGFNVVISDSSKTRKNYLCGDDEFRAKSLNEFFADDSIDAIIATRGGYGAIRIIDLIDYELIKNHPKIFAGYSDITALSLMMYKRSGLITYNAPMAYSDFGSEISSFSADSFLSVMQNGIKEICIENSKVYFSGMTSGILWGGNLSTVQSLCGLDFIPDKNFIFIAEDINEPVYKIDKMFTQLLNIADFKKNLKGIVLGDFSGIDNESYFVSLFEEFANCLRIPIVSGLKFGHEKDKLTFPMGDEVILDTNLSKIIFK